MPNRTCTYCKMDHPDTLEFWYYQKNGHARCRQQERQYQQAYRATNKDKLSAYRMKNAEHIAELSALRHSKNKEATADRRRLHGYYTKWRYGVDAAQLQEMLKAQDNKCAICGTQEPGNGRANFSIDHDHTTGKVRGLLCCNCNFGIGNLKDSPEILMKAKAYLERQTVEDYCI